MPEISILPTVHNCYSAGNPKIVRLGHPARLAPHLLRFSLEALIEGADGTEIVRDVRAVSRRASL